VNPGVGGVQKDLEKGWMLKNVNLAPWLGACFAGAKTKKTGHFLAAVSAVTGVAGVWNNLEKGRILENVMIAAGFSAPIAREGMKK